MKQPRCLSATILLILFLVSCTGVEDQPPKNIILLIGDGMGFAQVTAANYEFDGLNMTGTPYSGSLFTHSADEKVTDSAASGTAMSTGFKTNNGMLGQLPDGTPVQTIAEYAAELGKSTALLATGHITHATPAAFAVHHEARNDKDIIAEKFVDSGIDMLLGAGSQFFLPESEGGNRSDGRNLIAEMEEQGYVYIDNENELDRISGNDRVVAFLEAKDLQRYPDRGDQMNRLTLSALEQLSENPEGFFMMIEGSMIDWGGHDNDSEYVLQELRDFDNVVGDVLEFAENDGNTLVVITADHETGGFALPGDDDDIEYRWSTGGHTAVQVPVFSYGPSADRFSGAFDNTELAEKMFSLWGKTLDDQ